MSAVIPLAVCCQPVLETCMMKIRSDWISIGFASSLPTLLCDSDVYSVCCSFAVIMLDTRLPCVCMYMCVCMCLDARFVLLICGR